MTGRKILSVALGLCAAAGNGSAWADKAATPLTIAEHIFTKADVDGDGAMTPDEYAGGGLGNYGASFEDFDLDGDGRVTIAEYRKVFLRIHRGPEQDEV